MIVTCFGAAGIFVNLTEAGSADVIVTGVGMAQVGAEVDAVGANAAGIDASLVVAGPSVAGMDNFIEAIASRTGASADMAEAAVSMSTYQDSERMASDASEAAGIQVHTLHRMVKIRSITEKHSSLGQPSKKINTRTIYLF